MTKSTGIKFGLRKRSTDRGFWSVRFDVNNGKIVSIEPGDSMAADRLVVSYAKVKNILAGLENQENFRVSFDNKIGDLDIINVKVNHPVKKRQTWNSWLTSAEVKETNLCDIKCVFFEDQILRIEASRRWSTKLAENPNRIPSFSVYVTDEQDPHLFLGMFSVPTARLIEKGYYETRLYAFMNPSIVDAVMLEKYKIRVNLPPVAETMEMVRYKKYFPFTGIIDDQTVISHGGEGKHVTLFLKGQEIWAQSHYHPGSAIDDVKGSIRAGMFLDDPDNFLGWIEFPALMLRQSVPFKVLGTWSRSRPPDLLYKANNIDIGVLK